MVKKENLWKYTFMKVLGIIFIAWAVHSSETVGLKAFFAGVIIGLVLYYYSTNWYDLD